MSFYTVRGIDPKEPPLPHWPEPPIDERKESPILRGRQYRVSRTTDQDMLVGQFWACYQLRQPEDAPVPKQSVCHRQSFSHLSEAVRWIEQERTSKGLDFNLPHSEERGQIYTSKVELFKAWWNNNVTFKQL